MSNTGYFVSFCFCILVNGDNGNQVKLNTCSLILLSTRNVGSKSNPSTTRDFLAILGRGPRAFQIGNISAVNP